MTKIATYKKRRGKHTPQRDMCILFIGCQMRIVLIGTPSDLPYDKHIGVVEMTRIGKRRHNILTEPDITHAFPVVGDVHRGSPAIATYFGTPGPHITHAVLAKAKDDIPRYTVQRGAHHDIRFFQPVERVFEIG